MIAQLDKQYVLAAKARTLVRLTSYGLFEGRPHTTRGQWLNPAVKAHLRIALLRRTVPRPPVRPIFLLGVGRSGTTLLGKLLGLHPDVAFLNEPKMIWHLIDPVEDVSGFYNLSDDAHVVRTADDVNDAMRTRATKLYAHYLSLTRSSRVVDKSPEMGFRRGYLKAMFPDSVLIAIVRRPQAVATSIADWSERNSADGQDWWGVNGRKWTLLRDSVLAEEPDAETLLSVAQSKPTEIDKALLEWIVGQRALIRSTDEYAALDCLIRYEDLVRQPQVELQRVLKAAGLTPSAQIDKFIRRGIRSDSRRRMDLADINPRLKPAIYDLLPRLGYV